MRKCGVGQIGAMVHPFHIQHWPGQPYSTEHLDGNAPFHSLSCSLPLFLSAGECPPTKIKTCCSVPCHLNSQAVKWAAVYQSPQKKQQQHTTKQTFLQFGLIWVKQSKSKLLLKGGDS